MTCIGCKYYDHSVDCCNADENCYMVGYYKGKEKGKAEAIDKCIETILNVDVDILPSVNIVIKALEKLKENNNSDR